MKKLAVYLSMSIIALSSINATDVYDFKMSCNTPVIKGVSENSYKDFSNKAYTGFLFVEYDENGCAIEQSSILFYTLKDGRYISNYLTADFNVLNTLGYKYKKSETSITCTNYFYSINLTGLGTIKSDTSRNTFDNITGNVNGLYFGCHDSCSDYPITYKFQYRMLEDFIIDYSNVMYGKFSLRYNKRSSEIYNTYGADVLLNAKLPKTCVTEE